METDTAAARPLPMEVLQAFADNAPVDLAGMSRALDVQVLQDFSLPDDVSARIERRGDGFVATVNGRHPAQWQRFTIAHELAHRILHTDLIGDGIHDDGLYRSRLSDDIERQANAFAAELLMPARLVRALYRQGLRDVPSIAANFHVSYEAARVRLRGLRLGP